MELGDGHAHPTARPYQTLHASTENPSSRSTPCIEVSKTQVASRQARPPLLLRLLLVYGTGALCVVRYKVRRPSIGSDSDSGLGLDSVAVCAAATASDPSGSPLDTVPYRRLLKLSAEY